MGGHAGKYVTNAVATANQKVDCGGPKYKKTTQWCGHAGQMCDECGGDGPSKGGFWGDEVAKKNKKLCRHAGKYATNAMETAHQKVDSGATKLQ